MSSLTRRREGKDAYSIEAGSEKRNEIYCVSYEAYLDHGEFDPGSERTLAARFKHASRGGGYLRVSETGERVSNT